MPTGIVKWFNLTKGYGFITSDSDGSDVFVHISAVQRAGMRSLRPGQEIEYEVVRNRDRYCAEGLKCSDYDSTSIALPRDQLLPLRRQTGMAAQERRLEENILQMRRWFTDVSAQLVELRPLVYETRGILFKSHTHSVSDILGQPAFRKVAAMFGTIEENIRMWQTFGPLDYLLLNAYEDEKRRLVGQIDDIQKELLQRKPTFWEVVRDALKSIVPEFILRLGSSIILRIGKGP